MARQHPSLELGTSGVVYTNLPRTTTHNAIIQERPAHLRVDVLTIPLQYKARAHASSTSKSRPSTSTMVSERGSRYTGLPSW